jgi:hypothetical protein
VPLNHSSILSRLTSQHQLVVTISAADILAPGTVLVFVFNPPESNATSVSGAIGNSNITVCSGKNSNAVSLTINP